MGTLAAQRLVFYNHTAEVSGAEVVLLSLLRGLDRQSYTPMLVCPEGPLVLAGETLGVPHSSVPLLKARFTANPFQLVGYLLGVVGTIRAVRARLKQLQPDLLHANSVRAGLVATFAAYGFGFPVVWHIHDILPSNITAALIRGMAGRASNTHLLAVSKATARAFEAGGKEVTVVYNSVDVERFKPDAAARIRVRQELGLTEDQVAIGVVGQLAPRKRQLELVEAFARSRASMPQAILLVVGTAQFHDRNRAYADQIQERVQQLDAASQVWLVGMQDDIAGVMNAVDLLAQNSANEPLGLALMEGFATGHTAAATGVDGVVEIVDDNQTGLLATNTEDASDLVAKIAVLVNDRELREALGLRARAKMQAEFAPAMQIAGMDVFYRRLLTLRHGG